MTTIRVRVIASIKFADWWNKFSICWLIDRVWLGWLCSLSDMLIPVDPNVDRALTSYFRKIPGLINYLAIGLLTFNRRFTTSFEPTKVNPCSVDCFLWNNLSSEVYSYYILYMSILVWLLAFIHFWRISYFFG